MATLKKRVDFFLSEEGTAAHESLQRMVKDVAYNTKPTYSVDAVMYPNNLIPFIDKHMHYLNTHPSINPNQYIANLRLMARVR